MDHRLLEIIACPVCNGKLWYNQEKQRAYLQTGQPGFPAARWHSSVAGNGSPRVDC